MNFQDSIFIFGLALVLFGPKRLPEIGRQIGKLVFEFRKASNEFKLQIEEELRVSEQAEREKKRAESEAALGAPAAGVLPIAAASESIASEPSEIVPMEQSELSMTIKPPSVGEQVSTNPPNHAITNGAEHAGEAAAVKADPGDVDPYAIAGYVDPYATLKTNAYGVETTSHGHASDSIEPAPSAPANSQTNQAPTHHG